MLLFVYGLSAGRASAQESVSMIESFKPGHAYQVDVRVKLSGRLALPTEKGKPPQVLTLNGESHLSYDERVLASDQAKTLQAIRAYRVVEFQRTIGTNKQDASIRPSVRRMVVKKAGPRKAPFSPDGPLTWGEIDLVRTDVFSPAAIPGLLPANAVKPGQSWKPTDAAVAELTDMEKVEEGSLSVQFVGVTTVNSRKVARLRISGSVRGVNEDGPNQQKLNGTAYFDLEANVLIYLSLKGTHDLLDGNGQTVGSIDGRFTMTRSALPQLPPDLSDVSLAGLSLEPNSENTLLLYDNPDLGIRFLYPRGWRVGAVQGKQVTLDHARAGAGILITIEPSTKVPAAAAYAKEIRTFLEKQNAQTTAHEPPQRVRAEPATLDRFHFDAVFGKEKVRLEYGVLTQSAGGATLAARLPEATAKELSSDVDRIMRSLAITRRIE